MCDRTEEKLCVLVSARFWSGDKSGLWTLSIKIGDLVQYYLIIPTTAPDEYEHLFSSRASTCLA